MNNTNNTSSHTDVKYDDLWGLFMNYGDEKMVYKPRPAGDSGEVT